MHAENRIKRSVIHRVEFYTKYDAVFREENKAYFALAKPRLPPISIADDAHTLFYLSPPLLFLKLFLYMRPIFPRKSTRMGQALRVAPFLCYHDKYKSLRNLTFLSRKSHSFT